MGYHVSASAAVLLGVCMCVCHDYDDLTSVSVQALYHECVSCLGDCGDGRSLLGQAHASLVDNGIYLHLCLGI